MIKLTTPDPMGLPDIALTQQNALAQTQLVTAANVAYVLSACGFTVRFNMMTANVELQHTSLVDSGQAAQSHMEMLVLDMCVRMRMKSRETVREILAVLAQGDRFHPMEDWMQGLKWDGKDRVGQLIASVTTDNGLWPVYLENWLVQVVEGVCGWRDRDLKKSLPHVLVLVGGQGIGKSHWLKNLGGAWAKGEAELHLSASTGKDHQLEALKFPMVELAELDGIFRKSDISHMKSFISREEDALRAPYDRRAVIRPRMTSFCASVNDAEFLNDTTGSRRFWPVQVEGIDWSVRVDLAQLWAQAYGMWAENSDFNLSAGQDAERAAVALDVHTAVSAAQETAEEYFRLHVGNARFPVVAMNRTEIMNMLFGERNHWNRDISLVGRVITDIAGKHQTVDGKQRCWLVPYNQFATDRASWPDKISLQSV